MKQKCGNRMITFLLEEPVFHERNYGNFLQRKVILSPKRISDLSLSLCLSLFLSVSLSLNIFHSFFYRFYCLFWVGERRLGSGHICFFPAKKNWKRCYFIWSFKHQNNVILVLCRLKLNFKLLSFASDYVASLSLFLATGLTARTQRLLCLHSLETQNSFCGQHDKT